MHKSISLTILLATILSGCSSASSSEDVSTPDSTSQQPSLSQADENSQPSLTSQFIPPTSDSSSLEESSSSPLPSTSEDAISSEEITTSIEEVTSEETSTSHEDSAVTNYYRDVDLALSGTSLKNELYNKIKGHQAYSYKSLNGHMKTTDRDWKLSPDPSDSNPYMVLIYGTYNFDPTSAKKHSTNNTIWDKEHIWAKSHGDFGTTTGVGSDLHNLRASDKYNNNNRGSYDFGRVDSLDKYVRDNNNTGNNSGKIGKQNGFGESKVYEPLDMYKGDVARALFYMATRYSSGYPILNLSDSITGRTGSPGKHGILSVMLEWNKLDPVDEFEFNRNGLVQNLQNNRNPFIDYPFLADAIWG